MARRLNYRQIADDLADRIVRGEHQPGSALPSYTELGALYDVSYWTVWRAIRILRDDRGMIYGEPGRGVFVADRRHWR